MHLERAFWVLLLVLCIQKMKSHRTVWSHVSQALFSELLVKEQCRVYVDHEWDFLEGQ